MFLDKKRTRHIYFVGADAYANAFDLGDTGGVPKEEYADTFPDKYIMKVFKHQQESYRRYLDGIKASIFCCSALSCSALPHSALLFLRVANQIWGNILTQASAGCQNSTKSRQPGICHFRRRDGKTKSQG